MAAFERNGAVKLYHDGDLHLETHANGAQVKNTGADTRLYITGEENRSCDITFMSDDGDDYADVSRIHKNKDTGKLHIQNYAQGSWEDNAVFANNGAQEFYFDGSKKFSTYTDGIDIIGHALPNANNTYDLGSTGLRWRNIYTNDLHLSNEGGANDVDGTWGSYTIQEGAEDLFLVNKRSGKKYKFALTEVS